MPRKRSKKSQLDPTLQSRNRNRTYRRLAGRLRKAETNVVGIFRSIAYTRLTVNKSVYDYLTGDNDMQLVKITIRSALGGATIENWWGREIELPFRSGTLDEARDFAQKTAKGIVDGDLDGSGLLAVPSPEQLLFSAKYRESLRRAQEVSTEAYVAFGDRLSDDVVRRINSGMDARLSPNEIAADLHNRFKTSRSDARMHADTAINKAYTTARSKATLQLGEETGLNTKVVHVSALLPTTRDHHAARHGRVYTVDEQNQWWDEGVNRINCHCNIQAVIEQKDGTIIDAGLQEILLAEK